MSVSYFFQWLHYFTPRESAPMFLLADTKSLIQPKEQSNQGRQKSINLLAINYKVKFVHYTKRVCYYLNT